MNIFIFGYILELNVCLHVYFPRVIGSKGLHIIYSESFCQITYNDVTVLHVNLGRLQYLVIQSNTNLAVAEKMFVINICNQLTLCEGEDLGNLGGLI